MLQLSIAYVFLEHDLQCDHVVCLFLLCQVHIAKAPLAQGTAQVEVGNFPLFLRLFILRHFIFLAQF